jgi:hypothetical protein
LSESFASDAAAFFSAEMARRFLLSSMSRMSAVWSGANPFSGLCPRLSARAATVGSNLNSFGLTVFVYERLRSIRLLRG